MSRFDFNPYHVDQRPRNPGHREARPVQHPGMIPPPPVHELPDNLTWRPIMPIPDEQPREIHVSYHVSVENKQQKKSGLSFARKLAITLLLLLAIVMALVNLPEILLFLTAADVGIGPSHNKEGALAAACAVGLVLTAIWIAKNDDD